MDVLLWTGAGQIGTAIARRIGYGKKIIVGDINPEKAESAAQLLNSAGFDAAAVKTDVSSRESVRELISQGKRFGEITAFLNAAGVSPAKACPERILEVNLYGTALLLEEVGAEIAVGGAGLVVSAGAGWCVSSLGAEIDERLCTMSAEELISSGIFSRENVPDRQAAYTLAAYGVSKRVMASAVKWGERGARVNALSAGLTASPMLTEELNGTHGEFTRNIIMKSPVGRAGTPDELANIAELLMTERGAFITGADILADGGASAAYYCGALRPR